MVEDLSIIGKTLKLKGEDAATTIIDADDESRCIYVFNADNVEIIGFTLINANSRGIYILLSDGCVITRNHIRDNYEGIRLSNVDESKITGNTIENNDFKGISMMYSDDNEIIENTIANNDFKGIDMFECDGNKIAGNTIIENPNNGINMMYSDDNEIIGNTIANNDYEGIFMSAGDGNKIAGNTIANNDFMGIDMFECDDNKIAGTYDQNLRVYDSHRNLIKGNEISYSGTREGLYMNNGDWNKIIGNDITDNSDEGIRMLDSDSNVISGNQVLRNGDYGIDLEVDDDGNTIKNNIVLDNTTYDLYQDTSTCQGNVWLRNTYGTSNGI